MRVTVGKGLVLILLLGAFVGPRCLVLHGSHSRWEELVYQCLAAQIAVDGNYSLRGVSVQPLDDSFGSLAIHVDKSDGNVIGAVARAKGTGVFGREVEAVAPFFSFCLYAVGVVCGDDLLRTSQGVENRVFRPYQIGRSLVSLLASLGSAVLVFALGRILFGATAALIGTFCQLSCPVDCVFAHYWIPETLVGFLSLLSLFFVMLAGRTSRPSVTGLLALGAGLSIVLTILTRQWSGLVLLAAIASAAAARGHWKHPLTTMMGIVVGAVSCAVLFWSAGLLDGSMLSVVPQAEQVSAATKAVNHRSAAYYALGIVRMQPLAVLSLLTLARYRMKSDEASFLLFVAVTYVALVAIDFYSSYIGQETRYFLAAYSALALFTGSRLSFVFEESKAQKVWVRGSLTCGFVLVIGLNLGVGWFLAFNNHFYV